MINYKHINMDYLTQLSSGDNEFVIEMVTDWIEKMPAYITDLAAAKNNKNKEDIRFFAHKLQSSLHIIGAFGVAKVCYNLEELALADTDINELEIHINEVTDLYRDVLHEINEELIRLKNTND